MVLDPLALKHQQFQSGSDPSWLLSFMELLCASDHPEKGVGKELAGHLPNFTSFRRSQR